MPPSVIVRKVTDQDRQSLANLIHFEMHVHRHLDWRPPLDWMGAQPYLVGEVQGNVRSALVCPPDPPEVVWIRLFAVASPMSVSQAWQALWPAAQAELTGLCKPEIAAIPVEPWFRQLLEKSHFVHTQNIVSLHWGGDTADMPPPMASSNIRAMNPDDLAPVFALDSTAFAPLWRNSKESLEIAYHQALLATVAEQEGQIVGYQVSTSGPLGGHLARLAVHPDWRGCGIGYALVHDLLDQFARRRVRRVSVNTQDNNISSLQLYQKAGFVRTDEFFPVYQLN